MTYRTHWEGCYQDPAHHACALERIRQLESELALAKEGITWAYVEGWMSSLDGPRPMPASGNDDQG